MITLNQAAHRVANRGGTQEEVFIDPASIMLICSILSAAFNALRMWCQYRQGQKVDGDDIKEVCARRPYRIRRRLHALVKEKVGEANYRRYGNEMVNAILEAGAQAHPREIEALDSQRNYVNRFGKHESEL